jgi:hypothetical protein
MIPRLRLFSILLLSIGGFLLVASSDGATTKLVSAEIVTIRSTAGGKPAAIIITDPKSLATLETFFPAYRTAKSSKAGAWIARHQITFRFSDGSAAKVTTSDNDNNEIWSNGHGDFSTRGRLTPFVENLTVAQKSNGRTSTKPAGD